MSTNRLFTTHRLGALRLNNRIVMAPMTRSRAIRNVPNELMAEYYTQRATAGLIITEGVSPSPNGLGYARMPGIFSDEQIREWRITTEAVHSRGGHIFMQLMHAGRIAHHHNIPRNAKITAPSAVKATGQIWTDKTGMEEIALPDEMDIDDIWLTQAEFVQAAKNAIAAGFDGVELHGANGYLLEQFLSPFSNQRTDDYGGSIENRSRFIVELVDAVSKAIGRDRVGIRLSPFGVFNDMPHYNEIVETYTYLADEMDRIGIAYIHLVDHSPAELTVPIKRMMAERFHQTLILAGGYTREQAESELQHDAADMIAFGRPFINNPDLVERFQYDLPLSANLDAKTFYSQGAKGYTDYPVHDFETESVMA